jgi:hypothetical protein
VRKETCVGGEKSLNGENRQDGNRGGINLKDEDDEEGKRREEERCLQRLKRKLNVRRSDDCSLLQRSLLRHSRALQGGQVGRYGAHRGALSTFLLSPSIMDPH